MLQWLSPEARKFPFLNSLRSISDKQNLLTATVFPVGNKAYTNNSIFSIHGEKLLCHTMSSISENKYDRTLDKITLNQEA